MAAVRAKLDLREFVKRAYGIDARAISRRRLQMRFLAFAFSLSRIAAPAPNPVATVQVAEAGFEGMR